MAWKHNYFTNIRRRHTIPTPTMDSQDEFYDPWEEDQEPSDLPLSDSEESLEMPVGPMYKRMAQRMNQTREIVQLREKNQELMDEIRDLEQ